MQILQNLIMTITISLSLILCNSERFNFSPVKFFFFFNIVIFFYFYLISIVQISNADRIGCYLIGHLHSDFFFCLNAENVGVFNDEIIQEYLISYCTKHKIEMHQLVDSILFCLNSLSGSWRVSILQANDQQMMTTKLELFYARFLRVSIISCDIFQADDVIKDGQRDSLKSRVTSLLNALTIGRFD